MLKATGATSLGVVAVAWTIDCFVGFYLTLPVSLSSFWRKWKPAWLIKRKGGFYRLNFDLHRASGLWLWPVLFIFAWSRVMFNMRSVYQWVMPMLFDYRSTPGEMAELTKRPIREHPALDWRAAQAVGARLMEEQAASRGFVVGDVVSIFYQNRRGSYSYSVSVPVDDAFSLKGAASVEFDGDTGELRNVRGPKAEHSGDTITRWLVALHMARVFGLPYRLFVCALGLVITMLSATGVYIWWKKSKARRFHKVKSASGGTPLEAMTAE